MPDTQWLSSGLLAVVFQRRGDRVEHQVRVNVGGRAEQTAAGIEDWRVVARSIEGSESQAWPPSPPVQELHLETQPNHGRVALGVGMAGRSHWSISMAAPRQEEIVCEVACRLHAPAGWLGSRFTLEPDVASRRRAEGGWQLLHAAGGGLVELDAVGTSICETDELAVVPSEMLHGSPATVVWRYVWRYVAGREEA